MRAFVVPSTSTTISVVEPSFTSPDVRRAVALTSERCANARPGMRSNKQKLPSPMIHRCIVTNPSSRERGAPP